MQRKIDAEKPANFKLTPIAPAPIDNGALVEEAIGALERIRDGLDFEINPSNYDHDDVCQLNTNSIDAYLAADETLAKPKDGRP